MSGLVLAAGAEQGIDLGTRHGEEPPEMVHDSGGVSLSPAVGLVSVLCLHWLS